MGRPLNSDAEETRERILESALKLFGERGLTGVSIREIGRGAGVTLATVHHHFGTKQQLYDACIDSLYVEMEGLRDVLSGVMRGGGPPREVVEAIIRRIFRFNRQHRVELRLLMRSVAVMGDVGEERRDRYHGPLLDAASTMLAMLTGVPARDHRLVVEHLMYLLARNAVSSDAEFELVTGCSDPVEAVQLVEDSLVRLALAAVPGI